MPAASSPAIIVRFHCVTVSACPVPAPAAAAVAGTAAASGTTRPATAAIAAIWWRALAFAIAVTRVSAAAATRRRPPHRAAKAQRAALVRAAIPGSRNRLDPLICVVTTFLLSNRNPVQSCAARLGQEGEGHVQHALGWAGEGELAFGACVTAGPAGDRVHDG